MDVLWSFHFFISTLFHLIDCVRFFCWTFHSFKLFFHNNVPVQCHTFNRWIVKKDGVKFMSSTQILVIVHKFNIQITKFTVQYPPLLWSFQVFWWWSLFLIIKRSYQNKGWKSSKIKILKFSRLRFVPRRSCLWILIFNWTPFERSLGHNISQTLRIDSD